MNYIKNCLLLAFLGMMLSFCSCQKDNNNYGTVHVVVKYNTQTVPEPFVYIKAGTLTNPNIPLSQYDKSMGLDASSQATFENLAPGNYFFYAKGYSSPNSTYASGQASVTVQSRWRENSYEVTINMH
jgi:hypothetical protein